jgi:RND family efflux transporter MFP subunit
VIVQLDDRVVRANRAKVLAQIEELKEQGKQADVAQRLAQLDVERLGKLQPGSTSGSIPLVSRLELEKARLAVQEAQARQKAAAAKLQAAQAELKALDVQLDLHRLRAPIAGWLGTLQVVPGQTIAAGTPVADILDLDEIDVLCYAPPHTAARLTPGLPGRLAPDRDSVKPAPPGKLVYLAVAGQADTGNFAVKVRFPNRDLALRANRVVRVQVQTQPEKERLAIPEAALLEDQEPPVVVVARPAEPDKKGGDKGEKLWKAQKLRARLGVRDRERHLVEILGLESDGKDVPVQGLLFVTAGAHGLQDGDALRVEEESAKRKE